MSWSLTTPADNEALSQGASRIRAMKTDVQTALTADKNTFPGPDTANPKFYAGFLKDTVANQPAASADYPGRLYLLSDGAKTLQRVKDDGSVWEDVFKNPATQAEHASGETGLVSVAGTLTLDETSNAFSATGTEAITAIAGWSVGLVYVRWTTARILTHNGSTLILQRGFSRNILAGDVSVFRFTGANAVREVAFYGIAPDRYPGEVFHHGGTTPPPRCLVRDGSSLVRADYPGLFAIIGTQHGSVDASHFNLPDGRGLFDRGTDGGAANDPDAAARTAPRTGAASGDNVGSLQADDFKTHTHISSAGATTAHTVVTGGGGTAVAAAGTATGAPGTGMAIGNETRPKNVGYLPCIAY